MPRTPFLGTAYVSRSTNLVDSQLVNLYPEIAETREGKEIGAFYMAPGLDLVTTIGSGPIRGMKTLSTGGTLYTVSGNACYSTVFNSGPGTYTNTKIGTINTSVGPVSIIDNSTQVAFFDGVNGYLVSGGSLSTISLTPTQPTIATYQDGFGLVNDAATSKFYQSNNGDLSTWGSSNFGNANSKADNTIAVASLDREIYVIKQDFTEIWINAGLANFTFQRLDGVFMELGCVAPYSVTRTGEVLCWLSQNTEGQAIVVRVKGHSATPISTHSMSRIIQSYSTISDAIGYAYQQEGHLFYVLTFPTGNATWVYDFTTSALMREPVWHQRAALLNGAFVRHWGNAFALFNNLPMIGDFRNGNVYAFNLNTAKDNGTQRKWLRTWKANQGAMDVTQRFASLRIDMETGNGVPAGTNPQCMLRWSDDGGHTWSNQRLSTAGKTGKEAQRVRFNALGSTRRNSGYDRIFELSSTDVFNVALIGAVVN